MIYDEHTTYILYTLVLMATTLNMTPIFWCEKLSTLRFGKAPVLKKLDVSWDPGPREWL